MLWRVLILAICPSVMLAQSAGGGRHRVALTLGRAFVDERDESVSPLRYRGGGWGYAADYAFEPRRWRLGAGAGIRMADLEGSRKALSRLSRAEHSTVEGAIALSRLVMGFAGARGRLFAGAVFDAAITYRDQDFAINESRSFLRAAMTLAPALRAELDRGPTTTVGYAVAVPLLTGLIRSYSDSHQFNDRSQIDVAWGGPASRRIVRQDLTWTRALGRHVGFRSGAAVDLFDLRGDETVRRVAGQRSQLSASLIWWTRPR